MRIAIVSDYYFDYVGGAQTSMLQQKRALEAAGHTVVLISPSRSRFGPRFERTQDGMLIRPLFRLPVLDLAVIANRATTVDPLEQFFRREGIDVVHAQTEFGLAHAAQRAAEVIGIPFVHTVHSFYWASEGPPQASVAWLVRRSLCSLIGAPIPTRVLTPRKTDNVLRNLVLALASGVTQVVSPSAHQAADLAAAGVSGVISIIPNPIATPTVVSSTLTAEQAVTPNFLWVARCESVKRPLTFARAALAALARTDNGFTVDFVGDGSELAEVRKLVAGHPAFRVRGSLPHDEVLKLMDESACVVLTSVGFDNQPMTIAEAVSRERGVLYCDPQLSEGLSHAGYLTATPDESGLADALVTLSENPAALMELSRGAVIDRALFSPDAYVEAILAVYRAD